MSLPGWWMLTLGVCTHLVFLVSIFDIHFRSPLTHGMTPQQPMRPPPARRLVLFSADGLRADKFYARGADGQPLAPFLTSVGRDGGVSGVSHTRVPTESRPGHVALVAGVYEDPSAVTRGWRENPVPFDTVFNESTHTWAWGSPDIVHMLAKGASAGKVEAFVYEAARQDFASSRPSQLDEWVFDRVSDLLRNASQPPVPPSSNDNSSASRGALHHASQQSSLNESMRRSGCVFFLHLLGLDTAGHGFKPHSRQYLDNIRYVDAGVQQISRQFDQFFGDNLTAYVFTSDHGMTDWGSHGAGDPSETETPLVLWGAGVRAASSLHPHQHDTPPASSSSVVSDQLHVEQADLAPLMSALIGINFPVNSMGRVPVSVLSTNAAHHADVLFTNVRQLLCQYERRRMLRQQATVAPLYWPFAELTPAAQTRLVNQVIDYMNHEDWHNAIVLCSQVMRLTLDGIHYYNTYDRMLLQSSIIVCYLAWILLLISHLVKSDVRCVTAAMEAGMMASPAASLLTALIGTCLAVMLIITRSVSGRVSVYLLLPVVLSSCVVYNWTGVRAAAALALSGGVRPTLKWLLLAAGVEALVLVFFWRAVLSVLLLALAMWPLLAARHARPLRRPLRKPVALVWLFSSALLAVFPLAPPAVTQPANYMLVKFSAVVTFVVVLVYSLSAELRLFRPRASVREPCRSRVMFVAQLLLLLVSTWLVHVVHTCRTAHEPIPAHVHVLAWLILAITLWPPLVTSCWILNRLLHVSLSLLAPCVLLSVGHEALFCPLLVLHLFTWLRLEHCADQKTLSCLSFEDPLRRRESVRPAIFDDVRRAYFYLFFVVLAFFGVGNLDSVNSFDVTSVYAFVTVFSPWLMASLLVVKTLLPFLLVCCFSRGVACVTRMSMARVFTIVLLMLDVMSLHFFLLVVDTGSWLQIGTTISHHVIATATGLFLLLLHQLARFLTGVVLVAPSVWRKLLAAGRRAVAAPDTTPVVHQVTVASARKTD